MTRSTLTLFNTYQKWIIKEPLDKVVIQIHKIYLFDSQLLNGEIIGLLAKRLIDSEVEIGGPYISKDNLYINTLILRLFRALDAPLKKLEEFMRGKEYKPKNEFQKVALNLPIKIDQYVKPTKNTQNNKAIETARNNMETLNPEIQKQGLKFLEKIISTDKHEEISQISTYILKSIVKSPSKDELELCQLLGAANIYAWMAYTIYDDFIDEEGDVNLLSLANIMHRHSYEIYRMHLPLMKTLVNEHFDSVDNSNLWELNNCRAKIDNNYIILSRIPNYENGLFLAERAIGHVLGPKVLIKNHSIHPAQESLVYEAFNKYLIAKQINDDLSDWESDLRNGHLSFVVSKLLESSNVRSGRYEIDELIVKLKSVFWRTVFQDCINISIKNIDESKKYLSNSNVFLDNNIFFEKVLQPLKLSLDKALRLHINEKQFLKTYAN